MALSNEALIKRYDAHCKRIAKATSIDAYETLADKQKRITKLEGNYIDWFAYYFVEYAKCDSADFHKKISDIIIKNKVCKLLNDAFRGSAKSVHTMLGVPLYLAFANCSSVTSSATTFFKVSIQL